MQNFNVRIFSETLGLVAYFDSPVDTYNGRFEMAVKKVDDKFPMIHSCEESFQCALDHSKDADLISQIKVQLKEFLKTH